jgi:threonine/homoserine/homoserine lactone efflux protein
MEVNMFDARVLAFIAAVTLLTISPGSDTMLVFRSVLKRGQAAGLLTTLGVCTGLFVHAALSALGLSVILVRSAMAYEIVKLLGACYLIGLGGWTFIAARRRSNLRDADHKMPPAGARVKKGWPQAFFEGLLNNVLNPKAAIFYLAFLPQFINPADPVLLKSLLLAGIHFAIGVVWLALLVMLIGKIGAWLTRAGVRQKLEMTTGAILIGLGVGLVFERRA